MIKNAYRYARNFLTTFPLTRSLLRTLGHAGVLPPSLLKRLYLFNTCRFMVEAEKQDLRFEYEFVQGDQIGQLLYWRGAGGFEPETIRPFIQLVRQVGHFVDIGANTGHFTLVACAANSRLKAYAFEPVPHIFERLKRNVELNSWANRCVLEQKAVCDLEGDKVQFHVPESDIPTSGSLNPDGFNAIPGKCIEVGTTRLDKYFQTGPVPDLIKIDVENYEHVVLQGMTHLFDKGHHPALIMECLPDGPVEQLNSILVPLGYSFYNLTPGGYEKYERITVNDGSGTSHYRNWLLIPKDKLFNL